MLLLRQPQLVRKAGLKQGTQPAEEHPGATRHLLEPISKKSLSYQTCLS
jgi:hypothetical protein